MSEPGYALNNAEAVASLISVNNPLTLLTWTHPLLEFLLLMGSAMAFVHAYRHYQKARDPWLLCAWLTIIVHAIIWEILVFNFESQMATFWHGEFSIMLYHNRLPFYIVFGYYPALFYHSFMYARRLGVADLPGGRFIEAVLVGLFFEIFYVACEGLSPLTQWWKWDATHISGQPMWHNISSTSYLWGITYGFSYALLSRYFFVDFLKGKNVTLLKLAGLVILVAVLIPVVSMLWMLPVNIFIHGFHNLFIGGLIIALYLLLAFGLYLWVPKRYSDKPSVLLLVFPATWVTFLVMLHIYFYEYLMNPDMAKSYTPYSSAPGNLLLSLVGMIALLNLIYQAHFRRR